MPRKQYRRSLFEIIRAFCIKTASTVADWNYLMQLIETINVVFNAVLC